MSKWKMEKVCVRTYHAVIYSMPHHKYFEIQYTKPPPPPLQQVRIHIVVGFFPSSAHFSELRDEEKKRMPENNAKDKHLTNDERNKNALPRGENDENKREMPNVKKQHQPQRKKNKQCQLSTRQRDTPRAQQIDHAKFRDGFSFKCMNLEFFELQTLTSWNFEPHNAINEANACGHNMLVVCGVLCTFESRICRLLCSQITNFEAHLNSARNFIVPFVSKWF